MRKEKEMDEAVMKEKMGSLWGEKRERLAVLAVSPEVIADMFKAGLYLYTVMPSACIPNDAEVVRVEHDGTGGSVPMLRLVLRSSQFEPQLPQFPLPEIGVSRGIMQHCPHCGKMISMNASVPEIDVQEQRGYGPADMLVAEYQRRKSEKVDM